jgi:hypothetical protein
MYYNIDQLKMKLDSLTGKYIIAIWTDKADFVENVDSFEKLLEVRVFTCVYEFRAYRSTISSEFKFREIIDDSAYGDGFYDENQYLDIDSKASGELDACEKQTTGGGRFTLPQGEAESTMITVRYYYNFDSDGVAGVFDWRLVGFEDKEG